MITGTKTSMTNISKVYYEELNGVDINEMGEFYFHYNHHNLTDKMRKDYENYEESQINLRNKIISDAISNNLIPSHPILSSVLFGVSSIKNKPIIIVEY